MSKPLRDYCILEPLATPLARRWGMVRVRGWVRGTDGVLPSFVVVELGKRRIDGVCVPEGNPGSEGEARWCFDLKFSTGPGMKRIRIGVEWNDGRSSGLGSRIFRQMDRGESSQSEEDAYGQWIRDFESTLGVPPVEDKGLRFRWYVELDRADDAAFGDTMASLWGQTTGEHEVVLHDRCGALRGLRGRQRKRSWTSDPRIRVLEAHDPAFEAGNGNTRDAFAGVDWVGFLRTGDTLASTLSAWVAERTDQNPGSLVLYWDEDTKDGSGMRTSPVLKPAWNPDLLLSTPYIGRSMVVRPQLLEKTGGLGTGWGDAAIWDLQLRFLSMKDGALQVGRIPRILLHRRAGDRGMGVEVKSKALELLSSHLERNHRVGEVGQVEGLDAWSIRYGLPEGVIEWPMVSLVIPTRDKVDVLKVCVDSILAKTSYPRFEIVVMDNDSVEAETFAYFEEIQARGCRIERFPGVFNYSAINNQGVRVARGSVVGLLNSDLEVISGDWLQEMVSHCLRPEIGAVGARLLYPDGKLQHAGVILGVGHVAAHAWRMFPDQAESSHLRSHVVQNYSAVTAACLLVRKPIFEEIGGFNERELAITNNDVDLCIRICRAGYRNLYTPFACLYHHESASRGPEDTPEKRVRYEKEVAYMRETWKELLADDPAYHPLLTRFREDFTLTNLEERDLLLRGVPLF